jgi:hypothetical protein
MIGGFGAFFFGFVGLFADAGWAFSTIPMVGGCALYIFSLSALLDATM